MQYSYECEVIVSQLTTILDFIDDNEYISCSKSMLTAELSIVLYNKFNIKILPYFYVIQRYKHDAKKCGEIITLLYYNNIFTNETKLDYAKNHSF